MIEPGSRLHFGSQFVMTARLWRRTLDHQLAQAGMADASWSPLMRLAETGDGISQKQLAAQVGLDSSSLVRLIDRLEAKGQVERRTDSDDRRAKRLYLTPTGHIAVKALRSQLQQIISTILIDLTDDEVDTMISAMTLIQQRLIKLDTTEDATS